MRSRLGRLGLGLRGLATLFVAGSLALTMVPRSAYAEYQMPQAQRDHVDKMTNDVKDALTVVAKLPPEVAENASLAARASMISCIRPGHVPRIRSMRR